MKRLVALVTLLALGIGVGATLEALTGSPASYLAIPALLAIGWLFVANPQACAGGEQHPSGANLKSASQLDPDKKQ